MHTGYHWNAYNLDSGLLDPNSAVLLLDLGGVEWIGMALQLQDKVLLCPPGLLRQNVYLHTSTNTKV